MLVEFIMQDGRLLERKSNKVRDVVPHQQAPRPNLKCLGDLAEGATFHHDSKEYKVIGKGKNLVQVLRLGPGRATKPVLPSWLIVTV